MKLRLMSVMVDDQDKALKFYTEVLGFVKKTDIPVDGDKFLTVVSAEEPDGPELLLEPNSNPVVPARAFQKALYDAGIVAAVFYVDDIQKEYDRMKKLGVKFTGEPTQIGPVTQAVFDDTCGNFIQIIHA